MPCLSTGTRCKHPVTISSEYPSASGQPTDRNKFKVFLHNTVKNFKQKNVSTFYSLKGSKIVCVYDKIENFIFITVL